MQGAVADILNTCTVQIADRVPYATLVYTVHDSAIWAVPNTKVEEVKQEIFNIITQAWNIGGIKTKIPASFKTIRHGV